MGCLISAAKSNTTLETITQMDNKALMHPRHQPPPHIRVRLLGTVSDFRYLFNLDKSSQTYFHVCSLSWFWFLFCLLSRLDPCLKTDTENVPDVVTKSVVSAWECVSQDWSCNAWVVTIYIRINIHYTHPATPVNNMERSQMLMYRLNTWFVKFLKRKIQSVTFQPTPLELPYRHDQKVRTELFTETLCQVCGKSGD